MCIIENRTLDKGEVERAVESLSEGIKSASEDDHHKRAEILAERSQAFLSLGDLPASRADAEHAVLEDRFWAEGHLRRARAYEAMGQLELAQEAAMQAHLLEPEKGEYREKVAALTHNIGLTDYGVGPHPADHEKERRHLLAEKMKAGGWGAADWAADEEPAAWYRRPTAETAPLSLPYTVLHALELAIHTHHIDARVLTKGRLILHVAGATSEHEGASDFKVLFEKLPKLEELHVVQVGFLGVFGPCKTIVPDPQAPPQGQLVSQSTCLGNGRRMVVRKWLGMYHDFLEEASHHGFEGKGYLHEAPDLVLLANPGLDFFFDCWAPTVGALRDANYLTAVTGGNLDQSRRLHNLILQALGVKIALRMRTSRFGVLVQKRSRQVKNHNLMAFKGAAPLPPSGPWAATGHPRTEEAFGAVRKALRRLGVQLEAEPLGKARMERLRLLNDGDSVRSTASCCSDCGDGGEGRGHYVSITDLFANGARLSGAGPSSASISSLAAATDAENGSTIGSCSGSEDGRSSRQQPQQRHECRPGGGCDHASHGEAAAAATTTGSGQGAGGWHCRSFRKTDKGILIMED